MKNTKTTKPQESIFTAIPHKDNSNCIEFYIQHKNIKLIVFTDVITGKEANQILQQQSLAISSEDEAHQRVIIQPTHFELGLVNKARKQAVSPDDMLHVIGMMLAFSYTYWQQWLKHNNKTEVYFMPRSALVDSHVNKKQDAELRTAMKNIGKTISDALMRTWNTFNDDKTIVKEFTRVYLNKHRFSPSDNSFIID